MHLPRTQFRGVAHFVYAKWPRSGPEVWRSAGVIATLWQPRLVSCAGLVGQVEVERVVTLPWAQWSSASGFCSDHHTPLRACRLITFGSRSSVTIWNCSSALLVKKVVVPLITRINKAIKPNPSIRRVDILRF